MSFYGTYTGKFYDSRYQRDFAEARAKRAVAAARGGRPVTAGQPVTVTTVDETVDEWGTVTTRTTTRRTDEWGVTTREERVERPVRRYSPTPISDGEVAVATGLAVGLGGIALCAALFGGD